VACRQAGRQACVAGVANALVDRGKAWVVGWAKAVKVYSRWGIQAQQRMGPVVLPL
jgi:hypothetical protein